ncbi:hypothetical protein [Candidatus Albibeggiatoa sp. nov. BB20]|uniref:hypothetical protein n=1 Tax=Candidatus Albibeggiatoa sp. nov. BB20 TaxID=3162723 RepID=UPI003365B0DE
MLLSKKSIISYSVVLFLVIIQNACLSKAGIFIYVDNIAKSPVENIILEFTGGAEVILKIMPNEQGMKRIISAADSSLTIHYKMGNHCYKENIYIYFESSYSGSIYIKIKDNGEIEWRDEITL